MQSATDVPAPSAPAMTRDEVIAHNLAVVDAHFHNENPQDIDKAIALYADEVVWHAPARGVLLTDHQAVRDAYLRIFESMEVKEIVHLHRFATEEWVFDDAIFVFRLTGDGFQNCPYPVGAEVSMRLAHAFQMRDGKIYRENTYEIWRRVGTPQAFDDIPAQATREVF